MHHSNKEKSLCHLHRKRVIGVLIAANETDYFTTPATFEAVYSRHSFFLTLCFRDTPEIVLARALTFGPADGLPLQQVIGHQVAVFITRRTVEVDSLFC